MTPTPKNPDAERLALIAFLNGEAPLDGVWFGALHPTEPGAYWWRKHLRALEQQAPEWRPIESRPTTGEVVMFCDEHGNRWTDCAWDHDPYMECGYPATHWMPLPPPATPAATGKTEKESE